MRNNRILIWIMAVIAATPLWAQTPVESEINCPTDTIDGEIVYKYEV